MDSGKITILVFSKYYLPGYKGGGPIKTIKGLVSQLGTELSFKIITSNHDLGDISAYDLVDYDAWNIVGNAKVCYLASGIKGYKDLIKILSARRYDIVYLNSFFSTDFSITPLLFAKIFKQSVVLGPRGEFSEGALKLKSRKKYFFIKVYKFLGLHKKTTFQASSKYELEDIQRVLGSNVDIFVAEDIGAQQFAQFLPIRESNTIKAVFISRISPKKNLLEAITTLKNVQNFISYDVYGPIEDHEYWLKCKAVIKTLPSHVKVNYMGELLPEEVINILSLYDLFFMPTKGENYGHVIAEALCAGLPILISDTTPWRDLESHGIGWDLPLDNLNAFSTIIDELATIPYSKHLQMREKVLAWAKNKFSQLDAVEENIALFRYAYEKNED